MSDSLSSTEPQQQQQREQGQLHAGDKEGAAANDCESGAGGSYGWILRDPDVVRVTQGCKWYAHRAKMVLFLLVVVVSVVVLVQLGLVFTLVFYTRAVARGLADLRTPPVPRFLP